MNGALRLTPMAEIKALIDLLAELDIDALHLRIDAKKVGDTRPDIALWTLYRTQFERLCEALKMNPTERRFSPPGQREWFAESDTATRRLLVQCVSFEHHPDWQPRPTGNAP